MIDENLENKEAEKFALKYDTLANDLTRPMPEFSHIAIVLAVHKKITG